MVHQHFMLADNLTVEENVILGDEPGSPLRIDFGKASDRITELGADLRARREARGARRRPRRRRAPAGRDHQGAVPGRPDPDPRRADRGAGAAGGRRAVRVAPRAQVRGRHGALHLPQARRGAGRRRRDHRRSGRPHGRIGAPEGRDRPPARRADGRQRAAQARDPRVHRHRRRRARRRRVDGHRGRTGACSTTCR